MTEKNIFNYSHEELEESFGQHLTYEELCESANNHIEDVLFEIKNWSKKKVSWLLKILFKEDSFHKWRVFLAFWDPKWAIYNFEKVEKEDNNYEQAQEYLIDARELEIES